MFAAYKKYWKNYANFKGKASRSDYWWVVLINVTLYFVLFILLISVGLGPLGQYIQHQNFNGASQLSLVIVILILLVISLYWLASIIPYVSLVYRRYSDVGLSFWWFLVVVILGFILRIINEWAHQGWIAWITGIFELVSFVITLLPTNMVNPDD